MGRLGRELSEAESQDPENDIVHWRTYLETHSDGELNQLIDRNPEVGSIWTYFAQDALDERKNIFLKQQSERETKRDEREEETLKLAREANEIARQARREMRYTWAGAAIAAFLTAAVAIVLAQDT